MLVNSPAAVEISGAVVSRSIGFFMIKMPNIGDLRLSSALRRVCISLPYATTIRRKVSHVPRKYLILWGTVIVFCSYMLISDLTNDSRGPLGQFTSGEHLDWLQKSQKRKEQEVKNLNADTKVVTVEGQGGKRATIYRKPPDRAVPLQPDMSGRFPQDGHIITWDGLIMEAKGAQNATRKEKKQPAFPPMPDTYQVGDGKVISWDDKKKRPEYVNPENVPLPTVNAKRRKNTKSSWNPFNILRKAWRKPPKRTTVKYVPPTFPPMLADENEGDEIHKGPNINQKPNRQFPREIRKAECSQCFRYTYRHQISPINICAPPEGGNEQKPHVIIAILTQPKNAVARQTIRATWLRYSHGNQASVRYVFVMGGDLKQKEQEKVNKESSLYNDILQCGFQESMYNTTLKTMCALNWITKSCTLAKFVVRSSDQSYVNVPNILEMLKHKGEILEYSITGSCSLVTKVIRNEHHQWYVSYEEFPDPMYPPYCSAPTFVMSMNVAEGLVGKSPDVPPFVFDDVYLGLVARKLKLNLYNQVTYFTPSLSIGGCPNGSPWYAVPSVQPHEIRVLYERCQSLKA